MGVKLTANGPEIEEVKCLLIDAQGQEIGLLHLRLDELDINAENGRTAPVVRMTGDLKQGIQLDA